MRCEECNKDIVEAFAIDGKWLCERCYKQKELSLSKDCKDLNTSISKE